MRDHRLSGPRARCTAANVHYVIADDVADVAVAVARRVIKRVVHKKLVGSGHNPGEEDEMTAVVHMSCKNMVPADETRVMTRQAKTSI